MFLYGKNSIIERLKTRPGSIKKIFLQNNFDDPSFIALVKRSNVSMTSTDISRLAVKKITNRIYNVVALVDEFQYTSFTDIINRPNEKKISLIFLDSITDPQNLGSIIRTAACFGRFCVVIPSRRTVEVSETVLAIASGGENYIPVCQVTNISSSVMEAQKKGYWIAGAVTEGGTSIHKTKFPMPIGIVLGSENKGIRHGIMKHIDMQVYIPMAGVSLSLNVAVAAAVFCYEISKL